MGYWNAGKIKLCEINGLWSMLPGLPFFLVPRYDVADGDNKLNRIGKMKARTPLLNGQAGMLSGTFAV